MSLWIQYIKRMLKLKKLDKFILKSFGLLFVATFFICLFIFMMQFLWRFVDDLVGKGLDMSVLGQFFFYSSLNLVPAALPLAVLLASLITFGNFGERFELLAMKAAGISLFRIMRSLIVTVVLLSAFSFYFQDRIAPKITAKFYTLLISIRQKSPELDIPEGTFYNEIDGYNIYVKKKNRKTGMLYDVIIYEFSDGFENARILASDSARLSLTEDKQYLYLYLYSGKLFENLKAQDGSSENIPYRRETFETKDVLIEFDSGFNMADASIMDSQAVSKDINSLNRSIDSLTYVNDSIGRSYYNYAKDRSFNVLIDKPSESDSVKLSTETTDSYNVDSLFSIASLKTKQSTVNMARRDAESFYNDWSFNEYVINNNDLEIRKHQISLFEKITLSVSCLIFFFVGAPLGGIIRKGGLGMPVVISVLIFIVYYIINTSGTKLAREGEWPVWMGMWLSSFILAPIGAFLTYKSNKDSVIMNSDVYVNWFKRVLGIRPTRHYPKKEVVIHRPNYEESLINLEALNDKINSYLVKNRLKQFPNYLKLWFTKGNDDNLGDIISDLEHNIEVLANSDIFEVLSTLNRYPVIPARAHLKPFKYEWMDAIVGVIIPLGLFFNIRIWVFRMRLLKDLNLLLKLNNNMKVVLLKQLNAEDVE